MTKYTAFNRKTLRNFLLSGAGLTLAACGGGDGGNNGGNAQGAGQGAGQGAQPPVFDIGTELQGNENADLTFALSAFSQDGGAVTFTLGTGADAAFFAIDAGAGALVSNQAFDFERPEDANADGVYEVPVRATANGLSTEQVFRVTIDDIAEAFNTVGGAAVAGVEDADLGESVAAIGDFDGDGVGDYMIGASFNDVRENGGSVFIVPGTLFASSQDDVQGLFGNPQVGVINGGGDFLALGFSIVLLDDYDNDGLPEIAIGAPETSSADPVFSNLSQSAGVISATGPSAPAPTITPTTAVSSATTGDYVIMRGSAVRDALVSKATIDLTDANAATDFITIVGADINSAFGSAGARYTDIEGDGLDEFVACEPQGNIERVDTGGPISFLTPAGRAHLISSNAIAEAFAANDDILLQPNSFKNRQVVMNGYADVGFGATSSGLCISVADIGDFDGDLANDLALGAPLANNLFPQEEEGTGAIYVLYASDLQRSLINGEDIDLIEVQERNVGTFITLRNSDNQLRNEGSAITGEAVGIVSGIGDVNGDDIDDIMIGAPGFGLFGEVDPTGAVFVVYGAPDRPETEIDLDILVQDGNGARLVGDAFSGLGISISLMPDFFGAGEDGVVVGALEEIFLQLPQFSGQVNLTDPTNLSLPEQRELPLSNSAFVFKKSIFSSPTATSIDVLGDNVIRITEIDSQENDEAGFPVVNAGDIDGDGIEDILISASATNVLGEEEAGVVYSLSGSFVLQEGEDDGVVELNEIFPNLVPIQENIILLN